MRRFCTHHTRAGWTHRRPFFWSGPVFRIIQGLEKASLNSRWTRRRNEGTVAVCARDEGEKRRESLSASLETSNMAESKRACCSSPAAMCYWFAASLIAWGVLSAAGSYWRPLHWYSASTVLFAMAIGCVANWLRNRSFHCAITAPLFLIAAIVFLLAHMHIAHVNVSLVWSLLLIGTAIAFLLEWRYAKRSAG
jgi:hypothetical protein